MPYAGTTFQCLDEPAKGNVCAGMKCAFCGANAAAGGRRRCGWRWRRRGGGEWRGRVAGASGEWRRGAGAEKSARERTPAAPCGVFIAERRKLSRIRRAGRRGLRFPRRAPISRHHAGVRLPAADFSAAGGGRGAPHCSRPGRAAWSAIWRTREVIHGQTESASDPCRIRTNTLICGGTDGSFGPAGLLLFTLLQSRGQIEQLPRHRRLARRAPASECCGDAACSEKDAPTELRMGSVRIGCPRPLAARNVARETSPVRPPLRRRLRG
jgi:hypothetical protein